MSHERTGLKFLQMAITMCPNEKRYEHFLLFPPTKLVSPGELLTKRMEKFQLEDVGFHLPEGHLLFRPSRLQISAFSLSHSIKSVKVCYFLFDQFLLCSVSGSVVGASNPSSEFPQPKGQGWTCNPGLANKHSTLRFFIKLEARGEESLHFWSQSWKGEA